MAQNKRFTQAIALCASALIMAGAFSACKPTEKNYKAAYDAALSKREKSCIDTDLGIDMTALEQDDVPKWERLGKDSVLVFRQPLRVFENDSIQRQPCNVAVAAFKMTTNARSLCERLLGEGYGAYIMTNGLDDYYVIAAGFQDLESAAAFIRDYKKKNPEATYVGLPGNPVVEIPSTL